MQTSPVSKFYTLIVDMLVVRLRSYVGEPHFSVLKVHGRNVSHSALLVAKYLSEQLYEGAGRSGLLRSTEYAHVPF
jgi:hypothetical protein